MLWFEQAAKSNSFPARNGSFGNIQTAHEAAGMPQDWFIRRGQIAILPGKNLFPADSLAHLQIMVQESREPERSQWTTVLGGTRRNFQKHPARTQKSLSNTERPDLGRLRLRIVNC
jgi:hypothetical protein